LHAYIHLGGERHCESNSNAKEHNTMSPARADKPEPFDQEAIRSIEGRTVTFIWLIALTTIIY